MKSPSEYFKDYRRYPEIIAFLQSKAYDITTPIQSYENDLLLDWFLRNKMCEARELARKSILPALKQQRKDKLKRYYLVFDGLGDYNYMVYARSLDRVCNRAGRYNKNVFGPFRAYKAEDIIKESLFEYFSYTGNSMETLKISSMDEDEVVACGLFNLEKPVKPTVVCVKESFWGRYEYKSAE